MHTTFETTCILGQFRIDLQHTHIRKLKIDVLLVVVSVVVVVTVVVVVADVVDVVDIVLEVAASRECMNI